MGTLLIKIADLKKGSIGYAELATHFKANLPKEIFLEYDIYDIIFQCLSLINFKSLSSDKQSIISHAERVLRLVLFRKNYHGDPIKDFVPLLLRFKTLPIRYKSLFEKEAKSDLKEVDSLLKYYNSLPVVIDYISDKSTAGRNHYEKTILVFYRRTIEKRDQIIEFILHKVDSLSLDLARTEFYDDFIVKLNGSPYSGWKKYYYEYKDWVHNNTVSCKIDFEKLDHRRINPFRNKIFIGGIINKIDDGYDAGVLNKILLSKTPVKRFLARIIEYAKLLPKIGNRVEIFEQLQFLFLKKKWYAFYALALPQVEGLFSEMVQIISPNKNLQNALPDKVNAVRPHYSMSSNFFDYYQYYLPNQRNRFAHTGKDDDIQIKSYHILIDLYYICDIFSDLDTPLLEVIRIANKGIGHFEHIGDVAKFVSLVKELVLEKSLKEKEEYVKQFLYKLFTNEIDIVAFMDALQVDFDNALDEFEKGFMMLSGYVLEDGISFKGLTKPNLFKNSEVIKGALDKGMAFIVEAQIKLLIDTNTFVRKIYNIFKDVPDEIQKPVNDFFEKNKEALDKINLFGPGKQIPVDVPEYFMLFDGKQWEHAKILKT